MTDDPDDLLHLPSLPEADFGEALAEILGANGALTLDQLVDHAYADGWDLGDDPEDAVLEALDDDERSFHPLDDGRWVHLPALLEGRLFTHRLTQAEVDHDVLTVEPDLTMTEMLAELPGFARLSAGGSVGFALARAPRRDGVREIPDTALDELGSLVLPTGTLAGLDRRAGDLIGLRHGADGLEVVAVDDTTPLSDAVRDYALQILDEDEPTESIDLLGLLLADALDAFAVPTSPVSENLSDWNAGYRDGLIAGPGFDWEGWRPRVQAKRLADLYGLPDEEARAVTTLRTYVLSTTLALDAVGERLQTTELDLRQIEEQQLDDLLDGVADTLDLAVPDPGDLERSLAQLIEPPVAYALADELYGSDPVRSGIGLAVAAESLLELATRPSRGALHWLWARGLEWQGDLASAEEQLRTADRLDPDFYPPVLDLARLASDRGDASTGLALLARVPEDVAPFLRSVLEEQRPQPTRMIPRNNPCWCGSGRKFKACHLRQPQSASLADRAPWLYAKGIVYALESGWAGLIELLSEIRTADVASEDLAHEVANDGLVLDVALFEGGVFAEYLAARGHLLPPDELILAQQWLLTERSAYEVTEVEPGVSVTFRDLRTGDHVSAADSLASQTLRPGHLVCCHLLPRPDGDHAIHSIDPIGLLERSALIALLDEEKTDPEILVAFLSRHLAPPRMVNTEGHPLILCEVQLSSADPSSLGAFLDERFGPAGDPVDGSTWVDHVVIDGQEKVRATLTLAGDRLTLSTNSTERRDLVLAGLLDLRPDLSVATQSETDPRRLTDGPAPSAGSGPRSSASPAVGAFGQPLADSPEVRSAVADLIRGYETRWLDEQIPALEGLTPREAASDPTRRGDLVRLLATFPPATDPTQMDPDRLRAALGL